MIEQILAARPRSTSILLGNNRFTLCKTAREGAVQVLGDKRPLRNTHPDYTEVDAATTDTEGIRNWVSSTDRKPFEGGFQVHTILNVDELDEAASNSMLKTVEQPPENTCIIMTATNSSRVIPTILSRAFRVTVKSEDPMSVEAMKNGRQLIQSIKSADRKQLLEITKSENIRTNLEAGLLTVDSIKVASIVIQHISMLDSYVNQEAVVMSLHRKLRVSSRA